MIGWRISRAGGSNPPPPPPVVVVVGDGLQNVCFSRAVWLKGWAVLTASMNARFRSQELFFSVQFPQLIADILNKIDLNHRRK